MRTFWKNICERLLLRVVLMQKRFSGKKRKFSFFLYQTSNKVREKYVSVFTVLFFFSRTYQWVTSWYPEIMAFAIPFIPPKKVSFPEDPLLTKFFYDEVLNEEELGRVLFGSTCNARLRETLLPYKNLFNTNGMK